MLGHSSLEMSSLREEESVEDLGDGVEVCHHHHAEDDGEGDQEAHHHPAQPALARPSLQRARPGRHVAAPGLGTRARQHGVAETVSLDDDEDGLGEGEEEAAQVEVGVGDAAQLAQTGRRRGLDRPGSEGSEQPGGGELIVNILDISASAHNLVEKVPYVVSRES